MSQEQCLCPSCGAQQPASEPSCGQCGESLWLHARYRLLEVLGQSAGITYLARDLTDDRLVVVKELAMRRLDSWKTEDLFLREAEVLRKLDHPRIPRYLDHFSEGQGKQQSLYLVQSHIPGKNLQQLLDESTYTEEDIFDWMREALELLEYLQNQRPPVIHRDIKPSNMLRGDDGKLYLIDFGSVKDLGQQESRGETVAGTFGYMAPEQFKGKATPQSDFYGLGVSALALLSRSSPDAFMDVGVELHWQQKVQMSEAMRDLLARFLAHEPEARVPDAKEALKLVEDAQQRLAGPPLAKGTGLPMAFGKLDGSHTPEPAASMWDDDDGKQGSLGETTKSGVLVAAVLGLIALVFGSGVAMYASAPPRPQPRRLYIRSNAGLGAASLPTCESSRCASLPLGLMGLKFGMTLKQVKAYKPNAKVDKEFELPKVAADGDVIMAVIGALASVRIPGHRVYMVMPLLGEQSKCVLDFGIQYTLSSIECRLGKASKQDHKKAENAMLRQLYSTYGAPGKKRSGRHFFLKYVRAKYWKWQGKQSSMAFYSAKDDPSLYALNSSHYSRLKLSVTWNRWTKLYKLAKKEANRRKLLRIRETKWKLPALWRLPKGWEVAAKPPKRPSKRPLKRRKK